MHKADYLRNMHNKNKVLQFATGHFRKNKWKLYLTLFPVSSCNVL